MKRTVIKERKAVLVIGILCTIIFVFFCLCGIIGGLMDSDITFSVVMAVCFTPFILLGVYTMISYYRRRIEFYDDSFVVTKTFSKPVRYFYHDIDRVIVITKKQLRFILFHKNKKRLAAFEGNMQGIAEAIDILDEHGVLFSDEKLIEYAGYDTESRKLLKWYEKNSYITTWNLQKDAEYIKERYSISRIRKEKKVLRIIGFILIGIDVAAFLAGGRILIAGYVFVLLFVWVLYLYFYPRIRVESISDESQKEYAQYFVKLPWGGFCLALLASLTIEKLFDSDESQFACFVGLYMIVLLIPYVIKLILLRRKERWSRILCVAGGAFIIAFSTVISVNYLTTFEKNVHYEVTVQGKDISRGKSTDYYILVDWQEPDKRMPVSKSQYESMNKGDTVRICKRKSIFHFEYWTVHK